MIAELQFRPEAIENTERTDPLIRLSTHLKILERRQPTEEEAPKNVPGPTMSPSNIEDFVLIRRAQAGDKEAFDTLMRKHFPRAYNYAERMAGNRDDASDVVAEAIVRVYRSLPRFRMQCAFPTWLHRILANCHRDLKKRSAMHPTVRLEVIAAKDELDAEGLFMSEDDGPSDVAESIEFQEVLQAAVDQLPEDQKILILLRHRDLLSYEEIAESEQMPMGTVKSRLNRARMALRELLDPALVAAWEGFEVA